MEPQNSQPQHPGLPPDDAAANLALATHLSTQLAAPQMMEQETQQEDTGEAPESTEPAPTEPAKDNKPNPEEKRNLEQDKEIADIRKELEKLLSQENEPKTEDTTTAG